MQPLRLLLEDRREGPAERHIAANKDPVSTSEREPHGLVMAVSEPNGEARSVHLGLEIEHAEHFHAVRRYCVLVVDHADVTESKRLHERLNDFMMRYGLVSCRCRRCGNEGQFFSIDGAACVPD